MTRSSPRFVRVRLFACLLGLAAMAACSAPEQTSSKRETARYLAHARGNYQPPGPPEDPWGPYIQEAATRFDMPQSWIRAVMRVESGGRLYRSNGELITSSAGAMGLMQVMPGTYDELRARYDLGDDPFHPRDNILAGVGYMREMYDIYGSPGFLAAYNAGPARLDDYLTNVRGLPDETRKYVAMIAPVLHRDRPATRSPAEQFAMNQIPTQIPAGLRYGRGAVRLAAATPPAGTGRVASRRPVEVAQAPEPTRPTQTSRPQQYAAAITPAPQTHQGGGLRLIAPAMAADASAARAVSAAAGQWAIQVGAFSNQGQAQTALNQARGQARTELSVGRPYVGAVRQKNGLLYRARMTGLSKDTAVQACEKIARGRMNCIVLSPDAQS
jgi:cell division protein FtsN